MKRSPKSVLSFIRQNPPAVAFRDLMLAFGVSKGQRRTFKSMVDDLVEEGELVRGKHNSYALPDPSSLLVGSLSIHRDGYGFVTPDSGGSDLYIAPRYLQESMHGDRVEVRVLSEARGRREGRVLRTVERRLSRITGTYRLSHGHGVVIPDDRRIGWELLIPPKKTGGAAEGEAVVAEIVAYPDGRRKPEGRIVQVLGVPGEPEVEFRKIVEAHGLRVEFPPEAAEEARHRAKPPAPHDLRGRTDLRDLLVVTIDGETARDFDDAVSIRREKGGGYRLWVSIADVSHYVVPGSALDREAYLRGTSVYFPDRAIPMLPEELSNGICSLNPKVDRLTLTAEMAFGRGGNLRESLFYPSVIRSRARLTYTEVKRVIQENEQGVLEADIASDLRLMADLALKLTERRRKRGSIDFDLPEPQIILDLQGRMEGVVRAERNLAHRLIEEFMLAANEAVASEISRGRLPSLYRVHEPPDAVKLGDFAEFISQFGYRMKISEQGISPRELQALLDAAQGRPEERLINRLLLRSMKQARYSEENLGHFGLAAPFYTHFTSPIRRYPDLVVHRILRAHLAGRVSEGERERWEGELPETARRTSQAERVAMEAEREIVDWCKARFMADRIGEEYDAHVSGVAAFGIFVELSELYVEGLVHVSTLSDDFYRYVEKEHALVGERGRVIRLGDALRVRVASVSMERKQVEFVPAESPQRRSHHPHRPILRERKRGGHPPRGRRRGR